MNRILVLSILPLLTFFLISRNALSQDESWVARYNGPANLSDQAYDIAVDGSGNVYVTGFSEGSGTLWDYVTIKYDASGSEQWVTRYNGPGNSGDIASAIVVDGAGNVYVTGYSTGSGTSNDYATIKYDAFGNEQWAARYNGPGNSLDEAYGIVVDGLGNVYVTGYSTGAGTSNDYATIKYDASGNEQWVARYNGPRNLNDKSLHLTLDGSGNVYVTGYSDGIGTAYDYATIKYDGAGNEQWVARYNGTGNSVDAGVSLALDDSGNVYVTGQSDGSGTASDYATIKYDASGSERWVARYHGPGNFDDYGISLALDSSGNIFVVGYSTGAGTSFDYATIKYDASGSEQWVTRYNGPGNLFDFASELAVDGLGNVYVTGASWGSGTITDYATIKYDGAGNEQWVARYNGPGNSFDDASALALDNSGNVYVTGQSFGAGGVEDCATIKYQQAVPAVTATISVDSLYLPIPAQGDTVPVHLTFVNNTSDTIQTSLAVELQRPDGTIKSVIPQTIHLRGNEVVNKTKDLKISVEDPFGRYTLVLSWGDNLEFSDTFSFMKSGHGLNDPEIIVSPTYIQETLLVGDSTDVAITISNVGLADLTWSADVTSSNLRPAFTMLTKNLSSEGTSGDKIPYDALYTPQKQTNLPTSTWISLVGPISGTITPGDSADLTVRLRAGDMVTIYNSILAITSNDPVNPSTEIPVTLTVREIGPEQLMSLNHTPGNLSMGIFNDGSIGADNQSFVGPGIAWRDVNGCFVGGPIFGTSTRASVNGLVGSFSIFGDIINVASNFAGGFTNDTNFDEIASADLDDSGAPAPYGVAILQRSYTNTGEEFAFVRYGFVNTSSAMLDDFHAGIFLDWDIGNFTSNSGGYDVSRDLVYNSNTGGTSYHFGLAALDGLSGARTTTASPTPDARTGSFSWITTFDFNIPPVGDFRTWIGTGPIDIAIGDTAWMTFAILAGDDLAGLQANADAARAKAIGVGWVPSSIATGFGDLTKELPEAFHLAQNYPNPFNPTTMIKYALPEQAAISLKLYNILGQEIITLVDDLQGAGFYEVSWDGRNALGTSAGSGIYFYRMQAKGASGKGYLTQRKMVFLR